VPYAWLWNFGDGTTSDARNPVHTYTSPGTYSVRLEAFLEEGSVAVRKSDLITVLQKPPVAGFTVRRASGTAPFLVKFTDTSTGAPTSWFWDFGDGATSTDRHPGHTYTTPGIYTVRLISANSGGENVITKLGVVTVRSEPPVARFAADQVSGTAPLTVTFSDLSTGAPTSWLWDFGDGRGATVQNPVHTYPTPGTYTVRLEVSGAGGKDSVTKAGSITVLPDPPVAQFAADQVSGTAPLTVTFSDLSTGAPTSWLWDFGDGRGATVQHPIHTYSEGGTYLVTLTASNAVGSDTSSITDYITVVSSPPAASFIFEKGVYDTEQVLVTFTDRSTGDPTSWLWDFGDGTTATAQHPVHTYRSPGTYTVIMTASNAGGEDTMKMEDSIIVLTVAPSANFTVDTTGGPAPLTVQFNDASTGGPTSWLWSFGDGATGTAEHPVHTYTAPGVYTVNLTVTNTAGSNTMVATDLINVTQPLPVASFTSDRTGGLVPLTVRFNDTSTGSPTSWLWSFGDGATDTAEHPVHTYTAPGVYTVGLNATNAVGTGTTEQTDYLTVVAALPSANFTANPTSGRAPLTVQFNDTSTGDPTSWLWDFGDGATGTAEHPVHTYTAAGVYTVNLTVTNAAGSNTMVATDLINATHPLPVASFTYNRTGGLAPLIVQFNDTSTGSPTSWLWSFGDGTTDIAEHPVHTYTVAGVYTVNLTVTNAIGTDTAVQADSITVVSALPSANFTANTTSGRTPLAVQFNDTSTGGPTSWLWSFGDGTTGTAEHPVHTYTVAGVYTVNLTVTNAGGSSSQQKIGYITALPVPEPIVSDGPGDSSASVGTGLPGGDGILFTFEGLPISSITIDTEATIIRPMITVERLRSLPASMEPPKPEVYQYFNITARHLQDLDFDDAKIGFWIPVGYIASMGFRTTDVALLQYHDGRWISLKTTLVKVERTIAYYEAITPGFSTFAIALQKGGAVTATPIPTPTVTVTPGLIIIEEEPVIAVTSPTPVPIRTAPVTQAPTPEKTPVVYAPVLLLLGLVLVAVRKW
jgi:PGF-pre-PGF domain-containing protein